MPCELPPKRVMRRERWVTHPLVPPPRAPPPSGGNDSGSDGVSGPMDLGATRATPSSSDSDHQSVIGSVAAFSVAAQSNHIVSRISLEGKGIKVPRFNGERFKERKFRVSGYLDAPLPVKPLCAHIRACHVASEAHIDVGEHPKQREWLQNKVKETKVARFAIGREPGSGNGSGDIWHISVPGSDVNGFDAIMESFSSSILDLRLKRCVHDHTAPSSRLCASYLSEVNDVIIKVPARGSFTRPQLPAPSVAPVVAPPSRGAAAAAAAVVAGAAGGALPVVVNKRNPIPSGASRWLLGGRPMGSLSQMEKFHLETEVRGMMERSLGDAKIKSLITDNKDRRLLIDSLTVEENNTSTERVIRVRPHADKDRKVLTVILTDTINGVFASQCRRVWLQTDYCLSNVNQPIARKCHICDSVNHLRDDCPVTKDDRTWLMRLQFIQPVSDLDMSSDRSDTERDGSYQCLHWVGSIG